MTLTIRPAELDDAALILRFVKELAEFEREPDAVVATEADLARAMFGERSAEAAIADSDGAPVGFALFFHNSRLGPGARGCISKTST